jgi:hypothetical protein
MPEHPELGHVGDEDDQHRTVQPAAVLDDDADGERGAGVAAPVT